MASQVINNLAGNLNADRLTGNRGAAGSQAGTARPGAATEARGASFAEALARETAGRAAQGGAAAGGATDVRFSAHATARLASRNISLSSEDLLRVNQATQLAASRGSRDALLMMDNLGLIVNIKNRTVLTAIDMESMKEGIVTNIDSTVMVRK